ncbi:SDR family oxidoreductase [Actinacidiphila guanduensis]|uniref:Uncharacterized conserved protein YbjT, contains NAD(P)-binding and DUF2867 domains n=1 Tax=Actinacidiphila guanduensis TaxID=310781 RepID=A0A1H0GZW3_9ACTN|nr:NAD(P)H-binding protein [Actinacidiphila guanduensis]SDO12467.1 Uncharacterized conserved protein YbjT, contains NAD(P)-binding and DUF2867 domains [Actinacidiphila guanduensis]
MIVVTGATGNVGQPLVAALAGAGAQVRAVSRRPPAAGWIEALPQGVHHRSADLADTDRLPAVLDGAEALFLLVAGDLLGGAGDPARLMEVAKAAGVRRVVLLSSQICGTRPDVLSHAGLRAYEDAVRESAPEWTLLRPSGFASNAFAWAGEVRARRTVEAPFADVALPVVDPLDLAEVAAAALLSPAHAGRTYVLTGPAAVSPREQADAIGAALGEPVRLAELTREQARERFSQFMPGPVVEGTLSILGEPLLAEQAVSAHVEEVLGRPAHGFAHWAERNAEAFR